MQFDFETTPRIGCFKIMISTLVPRPIAWVTTLDAKGTPNVAPYSFFNATRSRGKCAENGWRAGRLRVKADTFVVLAAARSAAISSSVAAVSSSSRPSSI